VSFLQLHVFRVTRTFPSTLLRLPLIEINQFRKGDLFSTNVKSGKRSRVKIDNTTELICSYNATTVAISVTDTECMQSKLFLTEKIKSLILYFESLPEFQTYFYIHGLMDNNKRSFFKLGNLA